MRLLDYLAPLYNWLVTLNPAAPKLAFVALVFLIVMAWRRWFPASWVAYSGMVARLLGITDDDTNKFKEMLMHALQGIPAAVIGGILAVVGTGGDIKASVSLALVALFAPLGHFLMSRYKGKLGTPTGKLPPAGGEKPVAPKAWNDIDTPPSLPGARMSGPILAALLLVSCNHDARPCSAEDLATGPLALHNAKCAAKRQAKFPNLPDDTCDATPGCKAIVGECDRWTEERCK